MTTKIARKEATAAGEAASVYLIASTAIEIDDNPSLTVAVEALADIKIRHKAIDAARTRITKPMLEAKREVDALFKPPLDAYKESEKLIKRKIGDFKREQEEARTALLLKAGEVGGEESKALLEQAHEAAEVHHEGLSTRAVWKGEVSDESKIPREWLVVDVKALERHTKEVGEDPKIPGWRAFEDTVVSVTASKVLR